MHKATKQNETKRPTESDRHVVISASLPTSLVASLVEHSDKNKVPRSQVIDAALRRYLKA